MFKTAVWLVMQRFLRALDVAFWRLKHLCEAVRSADANPVLRLHNNLSNLPIF
jgi:hypothetical protein